MVEFKELFKSADWKTEKHVPVIEIEKKEQNIKAVVTVGKEIAHPNKTEHHICWIELYFHPEGEKFPYQIGRVEFSAHGASAQGPDTSTIYTNYETLFSFKTAKSGTLFASSYCNIHGLWQNAVKVNV